MKKYFDPAFLLAFAVMFFLFLGERSETEKQKEINKRYEARINYCDSVNEQNTVAHQTDSILISQLMKKNSNH